MPKLSLLWGFILRFDFTKLRHNLFNMNRATPFVDGFALLCLVVKRLLYCISLSMLLLFFASGLKQWVQRVSATLLLFRVLGGFSYRDPYGSSTALMKTKIRPLMAHSHSMLKSMFNENLGGILGGT
jgi:hypothetical protein